MSVLLAGPTTKGTGLGMGSWTLDSSRPRKQSPELSGEGQGDAAGVAGQSEIPKGTNQALTSPGCFVQAA